MKMFQTKGVSFWKTILNVNQKKKKRKILEMLHF